MRCSSVCMCLSLSLFWSVSLWNDEQEEVPVSFSVCIFLSHSTLAAVLGLYARERMNESVNE